MPFAPACNQPTCQDQPAHYGHRSQVCCADYCRLVYARLKQDGMSCLMVHGLEIVSAVAHCSAAGLCLSD